MKRRNLMIGGGVVLAAPAIIGGRAKAQSASALGTTLTPFGADPKASADGLVGAWTGGLSAPPAGWSNPPSNPFSDDKPIFTVTLDNMAQYDAMLCEGQRQMLKRYGAAGFKMNVYPSRRSFAAPQYVYDNTALNVARAKPSAQGLIWGFEGAVGGVPFPILSPDPSVAGVQIMWNHLVSYQGQYVSCATGEYVCTQGDNVLVLGAAGQSAHPYYFKDVTPENYTGQYSWGISEDTAPPNLVGGKAVFEYFSDLAKYKNAAFEYLVGEGRIRQAPQVQYDIPCSQVDDAINYDEAGVFAGALDRYNWKYLGKKQMIVMYNGYDLYNARNDNSTMGQNFVNPELLRWEVHRCRVVEATLAPGKRHTMPHRMFYMDEDSWQGLMADGWDAQGNYWRNGNVVPIALLGEDGPFPYYYAQIYYNLQSNQYVLQNTWFKGSPAIGGGPIITKPFPLAELNPQSMLASGSL